VKRRFALHERGDPIGLLPKIHEFLAEKLFLGWQSNAHRINEPLVDQDCVMHGRVNQGVIEADHLALLYALASFYAGGERRNLIFGPVSLVVSQAHSHWLSGSCLASSTRLSPAA